MATGPKSNPKAPEKLSREQLPALVRDVRVLDIHWSMGAFCGKVLRDPPFWAGIRLKFSAISWAMTKRPSNTGRRRECWLSSVGSWNWPPSHGQRNRRF
jgi:hypothetical protein